jgi:hypothetical protein
MKKVLVIVGVILLVIGLLLMLFLWPMVGTIEAEDLEDKDDGTYKVTDEITDDEWDTIKAAREDPLTGEMMKDLTEGIDGPGTYTATVEIENGVVTKSSDWEKVPTVGGILGLVLLIVGIVIMILGFVTGRGAVPVAAAPGPQVPMEGPPAAPPPQ